MKNYFDMTEQEQNAVFRRQRWQIVIGFSTLVGVMIQIVIHIS